jgi:hypothetical protein
LARRGGLAVAGCCRDHKGNGLVPVGAAACVPDCRLPLWMGGQTLSLALESRRLLASTVESLTRGRGRGRGRGCPAICCCCAVLYAGVEKASGLWLGLF